MLDKYRWEYWLHRVADMSFDDYLASVDGTKKEETVSSERLVEIVKDSMENIKAG